MSKTTVLEFDADEMDQHADHTRTSNEREPTFAQRYAPNIRHDGEEPDLEGESFPTKDEVDPTKVPPGFHFVKDKGVYLMSNGAEYEDGFGEPPYTEEVVYARGFGPDAPHHALRRAVGGDDFVQFIPLEWYTRRPEGSIFRLHVEVESQRFQGVSAEIVQEE